MDLDRILTYPSEPAGAAPSRGTKRSRSGSPRLRLPYNHLTPLSPPLPELSDQTLPSLHDTFPEADFSFPHSSLDLPSTDYGDSSPLYDIDAQLFHPRNRNQRDYNRDVHRAQEQENSRHPGQQILESLRRSTPSEQGSIRSGSRDSSLIDSDRDTFEESDFAHLVNLDGTADDDDEISLPNDVDASTPEPDPTIDSLFVSPMMPTSNPNPNDLHPHRPSTSHHRTRQKRYRPPPIPTEGDPGPSTLSHRVHRTHKRPRTSTKSPAAALPIVDETSAFRKTHKRIDSAATAVGPSARPPTKLTALQCTICMDSPHELTATTCGHTFCRECIQGWLGAPEGRGGGRTKNCPTCRMPLAVKGTGTGRGRTAKGGAVALEIMVKRR